MTFKPGEGRAVEDLRGAKNKGWTLLEHIGARNGHALWKARHKCGSLGELRADIFAHRPPKHCTSCRPAISPGRYRRKP